jgi:ketosteroid isomerase-like protein
MRAHDELVRKLLTVIDARDWAELATLVTPDVVYDRPGYRTLCGVDEFLDFYLNVRVIADGRHRLDSLLTNESNGFCWGHFGGSSRTDEPISEIFADWYQFADGKVRGRRTFFYRPAI